MAVDGTVLDVPDSIANAKSLVIPLLVTRAAFPKVPRVMLIEAGTLIVDVLICSDGRERVRAKSFCVLSQEMLLMWDRGCTPAMHATLTTGCDYLGRVPANAKFSGEKSWMMAPSQLDSSRR